MPPRMNIVAVGAGGMLGAAARYLLLVVWPVPEGSFPVTVLVENVAGAFLVGVLLAAIVSGWRWRRDLRPLVVTGVLGSFTTFSALTADVAVLANDGAVVLGAAYAIASVVLGLVAAGAGIVLGRTLAGRVARTW